VSDPVGYASDEQLISFGHCPRRGGGQSYNFSMPAFCTVGTKIYCIVTWNRQSPTKAIDSDTGAEILHLTAFDAISLGTWNCGGGGGEGSGPKRDGHSRGLDKGHAFIITTSASMTIADDSMANKNLSARGFLFPHSVIAGRGTSSRT
jgi:hypothetical protein